jgi:Fe2+ transport system protein FeoA
MSELTLDPACPGCGTPLPLAGACGVAAGAACDTLRSAACGASGGCALLTCPGCGASLPHPRRSRLAWRLAGWLARRKRARAAAAALARCPAADDSLRALPVGAAARIVAYDAAAPAGAHALAALGLVPGVEVRVRQRHPAIVLEAGETTLALDAELAGGIRVRALPQPSSGRRDS